MIKYSFHLSYLKQFFLFVALITTNVSTAQLRSNSLLKSDSGSIGSHTEKIRKFTEAIFKESKQKFKDKQQQAKQSEKVNLLYKKAHETEEFLTKALDTTRITDQLPYLEQLYFVATTDIFDPKLLVYSSRNLTTSKLFLVELSKKLNTINKTLRSYQSGVNTRRKALDSLAADSVLYMLPSDTLLYSAYEKSYETVLHDLSPIDSALNRTIDDLGQIDKRVSRLKDAIVFDIDRIDLYQSNLSYALYRKELPLLFTSSIVYKPFKEILHSSFLKAYYVFVYFIDNHSGNLTLLLFLLLYLIYSFRLIRRRVKENTELYAHEGENEIVHHPYLSALLITVCLSVFTLGFLPYVISSVLWLISALILLLLQQKNKSLFRSKLNISVFVLFILVVFNNLLLEPSIPEILFILSACLLSIILGMLCIRHYKKIYSQVLIVRLNVLFFLFFESASLIAMLLGRYNLSKILLNGGFSAVLSTVFLYFSYKLLIKALSTYSHSLPTHDKRNVFVKLKSLNDNNRWFFLSVFGIMWSIIFLRNFYFYSVISERFIEFIFDQRTIGKYSFSFEGILVFIGILLFSAFLSRLISLLAGNVNLPNMGTSQKKGGIANWLLLFRLTIIIMGTLLAFAATGIPMDRLTIIMGSLGVGIGFGLQNIVGNLISGIVLAFERPIEIGDQIEVTGKIGRIKEIGIRSSKLVSYDGAEVIIPNNDLLSQHVINWTLSNNQRRIELILGVRYGSDLESTKKLLETILSTHPLVEKIPSPVVLLHNFNSSSIDFRLLFWSDINEWQHVKSEIILSVNKAFMDEGIEIPFPQQDVYIKQFPHASKSEDKSEKPESKADTDN